MGRLDQMEQSDEWAVHLAMVEEHAAANLRMQIIIQQQAVEAARLERKRQRYRQAKARGYSPAKGA